MIQGVLRGDSVCNFFVAVADPTVVTADGRGLLVGGLVFGEAFVIVLLVVGLVVGFFVVVDCLAVVLLL